MLQYLVTSKVRRRLLVLLWGRKKHGSVSELATAAGVAFSNAHSELKAMQQHDLVRAQREKGHEVFFANREHPQAALLEQLAASDSPMRTTPSDRDLELKQKLVALGAPLRGVTPSPVAVSDVVATLASAVKLARRDAVVARSLPLCLWKHRDHLDARTLKELRLGPEDRHAFALLLELAGDLGGDLRLAGRAEVLRDARLTQLRPFFRGGAPRSAPPSFDLAKKWGFVMSMDRESFRGPFRKFVK